MCVCVLVKFIHCSLFPLIAPGRNSAKRSLILQFKLFFFPALIVGDDDENEKSMETESMRTNQFHFINGLVMYDGAFWMCEFVSVSVSVPVLFTLLTIIFIRLFLYEWRFLSSILSPRALSLRICFNFVHQQWAFCSKIKTNNPN